VPPPGIPGPFSLGDPGELHRLLCDADLADVRVSELEVPLRAGSFEEWWERTSALAGPLSTILAALPAPAIETIRARLRETTAAYRTPTGVAFPGLALIAAARGT
jgi:hypothetical protein